MVQVLSSLDQNQVMQIKHFLRAQFHQTNELDAYIEEVNIYYEAELEPYYVGWNEDEITGVLILDTTEDDSAYGRVFTKDINFLREIEKQFVSISVKKLFLEALESLPEVTNLNFNYAEYMMTLFPERLEITLKKQNNGLTLQETSVSLVPISYKDRNFYENILKTQYKMPYEETKERFESLLTDKAMHGFIVYSDSITPIGICAYYDGSTFLTLFDLTILPDYQNKGYGKAMLLKLLLLTGSKQVKYLLQVTSTNTTAFHMYQQAGFNVTQQRLYYEFKLS